MKGLGLNKDVCFLLFYFIIDKLLVLAGYLSDDGSPKRRGQADMSVFRDAVQDCLDYDHETAKKALKAKSNKSSKDTTEVEKFSGLKIR